MFKNLGIISWAGCLLTLAYQAAVWVLTAAWPSVTLLDVAGRLGLGTTDLFTALPFEYLLKLLYVLCTTQLALGLWWLGLAFFLLSMLRRIMLGK